jgi:hypothetical protein
MTFLSIQNRFLDLIGETDITAITATHKRHINAFINDITNAFNFSWNVASTNITLTAGVANMPSNFNPIWGVDDARITASSTADDSIFTQIDFKDRDSYGSSSHVYWLIQTPAGTWTFNTPVQTGTVTVYYHFLPTDLSGDSDVCVVPDGEAVAYGAAAKNWIGDERNTQLKQEYEKEAASRIQRMYNQDLNFGPQCVEHSAVSDNPDLTNRGV